MNVELKGIPPSSYPLWIASGVLENIALWVPKNVSTVVIITDTTVKRLYAPKLVQTLKEAGYNTLLLSFPAGEKSKNIRTKCKLEEKMLENGCDRDSLILALGGGVVGDLAGFIAATYLRGIDYIQLPTTFLAMVDSSVGGKTGIDTPQGKNLIGAFWQPKAVVSDIQCLKTLPQQHLINGLIEAIKMFLTSDANSFDYFQHHLNPILRGDDDCLNQIVQRAVNIKATVVKNDEREDNQRAILNFGHTIGHALEQLTDYKLLHGYAVALGILVEAKIAELMDVLEPQRYLLIKTLLNHLDIQSNQLSNFDVDEVIQRTQFDKKKRAGVVHYVLLQELGNVHTLNQQFTHPVSDDIVKNAFLEILKN